MVGIEVCLLFEIGVLGVVGQIHLVLGEFLLELLNRQWVLLHGLWGAIDEVSR